MVRWYGMRFTYHATYQTTVPYQILQYASCIGSKKNIPMEVVLDNGSVSYHKNDVLEKWYSD